MWENPTHLASEAYGLFTPLRGSWPAGNMRLPRAHLASAPHPASGPRGLLLLILDPLRIRSDWNRLTRGGVSTQECVSVCPRQKGGTS